jgi:hypothetical protein
MLTLITILVNGNFNNGVVIRPNVFELCFKCWASTHYVFSFRIKRNRFTVNHYGGCAGSYFNLYKNVVPSSTQS